MDAFTYEYLDNIARRENENSASIRDVNRRESPPIGARYTKNNQQTCTNGGTIRVNYNTLYYDPYSLVTTGVSWLFTAPVSGIYQIEAVLQWASSSNWGIGDLTYLAVLSSAGATLTYLEYRNDINGGGAGCQVQIQGSTFLRLSKTDGIYLSASQSSGVGLNTATDPLSSHVSIFLIK